MNEFITLDLEFLALRADTKICSIGAALHTDQPIPLNTKPGYETTFERVIDINSHDGVIDNKTLKWWLRQSDEARESIGENGIDLAEALLDFNRWYTRMTRRVGRPLAIFGFPSFVDNAILHLAYAKCNIEPAWPFYLNSCHMTINNYANPRQRAVSSYRRGQVHHSAIEDAKVQAQHLADVLHDLTEVGVTPRDQ